MLAAGTKFGPYEVLSLVASGGMGEVYRARDTRLDRIVALKVISSSSSTDKAHRQRMQREARAISALQHPHICTLYDVGQQDGIDYLVMELLEGETLASRLAKTRLSLEQTLTYSTEIADALDAAQRKGIIHRDLKPGNVFLTSHGECKVLDFGLAKLEEDSPDAPTITQPDVLTSPGAAVGTVAYMSPEQARGEPLDARTDIFSLGTVLYEMATGKSPFVGKTSAVVFKAILDSTPPPPSRVNKSVPPRLDEVIGKCLEKDRELRYQSAAELRSDLKRVNRDHYSQRISGTVSATGGSTTSPRSRSIRLILGAIATLMVVSSFAVYYWRNRPLASIAFQHYSMARLTSTGKVGSVSLSRDGRYLVYGTEESDHDSLWIQQIATSTNVRLLGPMPLGTSIWGARFSSDGTYIYFFQTNRQSTGDDLYRMPAVGGTPVKILRGVDIQGISADISSIAVGRQNVKTVPPEYSLVVTNVDGTNEQQILTLKGEAIRGATWSPDGKTLAVGIDERAEGNPNALALVSLHDKTERRLVHNMVIFGKTWLSDSSGLVIVSSGPDRTGTDATLFQLWTLSVVDGKVRKLTDDLNDYRGVSLTSDSMKLVSVRKRTTSSIWVAPTSNLSQAREITAGAGQQDGIRALAWLPDGGMLYMDSEPATQIWRMDRDGSNRQQLTHLKGSSADVSVTSDGSIILFTHAMNVWRMDADGTDARQVTNSKRDAYNGEISSDGKWLAYVSDGGPVKSSLGGGDAVLLDPSGDYPAISRDGRWIAFPHWDEKSKTNLIEIVASDGGGSPRFLPFLPGAENQQPDENMGTLPIRWTASGDAITFVRTKDGVSNLWSQPINGGPAHQITNFTSGYIWRHAWSPDGKYLAVARGTVSTDAVLLTDSR